MKTGLILEGGAMRGLFSAGVLDIFMENGIEFDAAIGVSAGAAFGSNYKSRQIGRVIRYNKQYAKDPRFCSIRSLLKTGNLFGAEFCYHTIPDTLDLFDTQSYLDNPMDFYVVCTDLDTGKAVYINSDEAGENSLEFFRASASMPLVSQPVEINGKRYLDGGIADSIPIKYFESIGYDRLVLVLTQPYDFEKKPSTAAKLMKRFMKEYTAVADTLANRHIVYNETLDYIKEKESAGEILVIRPEEVLPIGRVNHEPDEMQAVYDIGRDVALKYVERIKEFLQNE